MAERFNTVHVAAGSANGGEFGSAGAGGAAKPATGHAGHASHSAAHPKAHAAAGPPRHTLAYNPKTNTGAGYGMKGGDPNVKRLQTKVNALGLTDLHGKPLALDGKLGPLTTSSIKALQTRLGVTANGQVSPAFFAQIMALKTLPAAHPSAHPHAPAHPHHRGVQTAHEGDTERLHEYWVHGEGAAKIGWGAPGDFERCVGELGKHISDPEGYCNLAHHAALGYYPATHAKMEGRGELIVPDSVRADMATAAIDDLPDDAFAYIEPGGSKDPSGKTTPRSLRHFPIHDKAHVQNALARAPQSPFGEKAMPKIRAAATKFGIDAADDSGRADSLSGYVRSFPLEDVSVRTGKTGREVTAYAAVFNTPTEIHDQDGHYNEELDPVVFNRAISDSAPAGGRTNWRVGVFYNHGMTLHGTPSDRHSMPIGVPLEIKPDGRGLLTRTLYHRSDFADEIVEGLESGAIPGYSFSGRFLRSNPLIPRGGFRADRGGSLRTVRRMESTLREYGPTPFPAYKDAAILGVRSDTLLGAMAADPALAMRMLTALRDGAPLDSPSLSGAPEHRDSPPEDSHQVRSGRSVKEELAARRSAFLQKYGSRDV